MRRLVATPMKPSLQEEVTNPYQRERSESPSTQRRVLLGVDIAFLPSFAALPGLHLRLRFGFPFHIFGLLPWQHSQPHPQRYSLLAQPWPQL